MDGVTTCGVSMMCRFLVMPTVVVLRRFFVVSGSVGMVFGSLPVMLSCFLRHSCPPCSAPLGRNEIGTTNVPEALSPVSVTDG
jgi:hypothetical protein